MTFVMVQSTLKLVKRPSAAEASTDDAPAGPSAGVREWVERLDDDAWEQPPPAPPLSSTTHTARESQG